MKIRQVMKKRVITVKTGDTLEKIAKMLFDHDISGVLVLNGEKKLVGLISEKDIYRQIYPNPRDFNSNPELFLDHEEMEEKVKEVRNLKAEDFMRHNVVVLGSEDPIMKAGALMLAHGVNRLPVMDGDKIVGIVSRRDIYRAIFKKHLK